MAGIRWLLFAIFLQTCLACVDSEPLKYVRDPHAPPSGFLQRRFLFLKYLQVICEVFFSASESERHNLTAFTQSGAEAHGDGQVNPQCPMEEGRNANADSTEV